MTWLYGSAQDSVHTVLIINTTVQTIFSSKSCSVPHGPMLLLHSSKQLELFGLVYRQLPPVLDTWLHSEALNAVWNRCLI